MHHGSGPASQTRATGGGHGLWWLCSLFASDRFHHGALVVGNNKNEMLAEVRHWLLLEYFRTRPYSSAPFFTQYVKSPALRRYNNSLQTSAFSIRCPFGLQGQGTAQHAKRRYSPHLLTRETTPAANCTQPARQKSVLFLQPVSYKSLKRACCC